MISSVRSLAISTAYGRHVASCGLSGLKRSAIVEESYKGVFCLNRSSFISDPGIDLHHVFDAIVVGAGPAGCSAASFLAVEGFRVLLLDKATFPRDKVCGDAISPLALDVLDRMGALEWIDSHGPWKVEGVRISSPSGHVVCGRGLLRKDLRGFGYVMPRYRLDDLLRRFASRHPNVTCMEQWEVYDLIQDSKGGVMGVLAQKEGRRKPYYACTVLAADGVNSQVAKVLSLRNEDPRHRAFAIRAYFDGVEGLTRHIEIHYDRGILPGYGWIFPVGPRTANVGVGLFRRFTSAKEALRRFKTFVEENPFARQRLRSAEMREGTLKGWSIPFGSYKAKRARGNVLLLGDAGSFVDTLTGEGIYFALRSGELAAQAVRAGLRRIHRPEMIGQIYETLWRKQIRWREYLLGYLLQPLLRSGRFLDLRISWARKNPRRADILASVVANILSKVRLIL